MSQNRNNLLLIFFFLFSYFNLISQNTNSEENSIYLHETSSLLKILSSDEMEGRGTGTEGYLKSVKFVSAYLKNANIQPYIPNSYTDSIYLDTVHAPNVIGYIPGKSDSLIVLGAHLDHLGEMDGKIYNGANDNATGVTALLQIAQYLKKNLKKNKAGVLIVFFTAEEMGKLGSLTLASKLKIGGVHIEYMLNFEMLGSQLNNKKPGEVYLVGFHDHYIKTVLNNYIGENFLIKMHTTKNRELFARSDNHSFYQVFDCPALTFITFDTFNYKYYHTEQDTYDKVDVQNLNQIINKLGKSILFLLEGNVPIH